MSAQSCRWGFLLSAPCIHAHQVGITAYGSDSTHQHASEDQRSEFARLFVELQFGGDNLEDKITKYKTVEVGFVPASLDL